MTAQGAAARPSAPPRKPMWLRFLALGIGAVALLFGLLTGLARLGIALPATTPVAADLHGALMICGFFGTLISLERAVALGRWWAYGAPAVSAAGALVLLAGSPASAAAVFLAAGLLLTFDSIMVVVRQRALFTVMLAVAAACWAVGTLAWLIGGGLADAVGWWLAFLVLTIAAERLELSRLLAPPPLSQATFVGAVLLILAGAARGEFAGGSALLTGAGLVATTAWLLNHDVAMRTVRMTGQARFSAVCMISGYVWLGVAGIVLIVLPPGASAFSYDASVHAIAIGFVLSMVFGHAPIILPAVTGWRVRYSAAAYGPLALLHASVLLRIGADLGDVVALRGVSGLLTILALAAYAATLAVASRRRAGARVLARICVQLARQAASRLEYPATSLTRSAWRTAPVLSNSRLR